MHEAIESAIQDVERSQDVKVLFACEAGSRAWGFASPDSDYDVRFVYVHRLDWYLRVSQGRDTIERMLPGDLDLSGWDLRKALALFHGSNAVFFEHIGSGIVYRDHGGLRRDLGALVPRFCNPIAVGHHYLGLAKRIHAEHLGSERVNLKKLFYVLRPLAAFRWVELRASAPPTAFADVLAGIDLDDRQRAWVDGLWKQKMAASERDASTIDPGIRDWIDEWMARCAESAKSLPHRGGDPAQLDALLATHAKGRH